MDAKGDAVAMWATAGAIRAAFRPAGQPWGQPQTVFNAPGNFTLGTISAAIDPAGDVVAAWSIDTQAQLVHLASHRPGGSWSLATLTSDASNPVPRVAVDAAGDGIVGVGSAGRRSERLAFRRDCGLRRRRTATERALDSDKRRRRVTGGVLGLTVRRLLADRVCELDLRRWYGRRRSHSRSMSTACPAATRSR